MAAEQNYNSQSTSLFSDFPAADFLQDGAMLVAAQTP